MVPATWSGPPASALAATWPAQPRGSGQGSAARSTGSSVSTDAVAGDRRQVDADVPQPRAAHGQRGGEHHLLVALAGELGQAPRDVDVGRREHARRR